MKSFEELVKLTDEEKMAYLQEEVELLIANAPSGSVLKLRALQAKIDGIRKRIKSPQVALQQIYALMIESFLKLDKELKGISLTIKDK